MKRIISRLFRGYGGIRYLPPPPGSDGEIVVLAHGLIRRSPNMMCLGRRLNRAGFAVHVYDYATTTKTIPEHGQDFKRFLENLAVQNPGRRINLVTHSMGGIITREALGHLAEGSKADDEILSAGHIGRIVMLSPPNQGSDAAKNAVRLLPCVRKIILPLSELSSASNAYIHQVPVPQGLDIGIIAGRFDLLVSPAYTRLTGMRQHLQIVAEHTFIMYMPSVARMVIRYLREGHF